MLSHSLLLWRVCRVRSVTLSLLQLRAFITEENSLGEFVVVVVVVVVIVVVVVVVVVIVAINVAIVVAIVVSMDLRFNFIKF